MSAWLIVILALAAVALVVVAAARPRRKPSQPRPPRGSPGRVLRDHTLYEAMYRAQHQDDDEERSA